MTNKSDASKKARLIRATVPEGQLKRLIAKQVAFSKQAKQIRYPDPDRLATLTLKAIAKLGFVDHDLQGIISLNAKGKKGKGKKGGGGKKLPDPAVVLAETQSALANAKIKPVSLQKDAVIIEWNLENCDDTKVKYFAPTYKSVFECGDLAHLVEVTSKAVTELAKVTGYLGFCSHENTRGQAVGFLVNPARFDVIGTPQVWNEVASVQGIPDLRPGFMIEVKDKVTGVKTRHVVVHLKSMRGGPRVTEPVRLQQFGMIAKRLGVPVAGCKGRLGRYQLLQTFKNAKIGRGLSDHGVLFVTQKYAANMKFADGQWIVAGDFNDFIDRNSQVTAPLTAAGYKLVYPSDSTSTQAMGGRLDGFFRDVSNGTVCGGAGAGEFADDSTDTPTIVSLRQ